MSMKGLYKGSRRFLRVSPNTGKKVLSRASHSDD